MPDRLAAFIIFLVMVLGMSTVFAGQLVQAGAPAPAAPEAASPVRQAGIGVETKDGLLSVDLVDAEFGSVMRAISSKTGIRVEMSGDIQKRKLTTRFSGLELERGILRLMTLMKEKNYAIKYDAGGRVNLVEVYGSAPAAVSEPGTPSRTSTPRTSLPAARASEQPAPPIQGSVLNNVLKNPPQQRRLIPPARPAVPRIETNTDEEDTEKEEAAVEELPYIPPRKKAPSSAR